MNAMKKQIMLYSCIIFLVLGAPDVARAKAVWCVNCSDKFTQALERVTNVAQLKSMLKAYDEYVNQTMQQIEMVRQNVQQYANMVQNTARLPENLIGQATGSFSRLAQVTGTLRTLRGDVSALGQIHQALYLTQDGLRGITSVVPSQMVQHNQQYQQKWDEWSKRVDEASQATFQLSGQQLQEMQQDSGKFQKYIDDLLSTPDGQQKAIMAGNQLAALQIQELRQLRELLATEAQSKLASQEKSEKEGQMSEEMMRKLTDMSAFENLTPRPDSF